MIQRRRCEKVLTELKKWEGETGYMTQNTNRSCVFGYREHNATNFLSFETVGTMKSILGMADITLHPTFIFHP